MRCFARIVPVLILLVFAVSCAKPPKEPKTENGSAAKIEELRKENEDLLSGLHRQEKTIEQIKTEMDALRRQMADLKSQKEEAPQPTKAILHMTDDESGEVLERAHRIAMEVSPYEAAKLLAKLSLDEPFSEPGMRAAATLRKWGVRPQDLTAARATEIDASVRKILEKEKLGWANLERAHRLVRIGRYVEAIKKLRDIATNNPGTEQGQEAREMLFRWGAEDVQLDNAKDEDLAETVGAALKAQRMLHRAELYRDREKVEKAREILQALIKQFPNTLQAADAEDALAEMEEAMLGGDDEQKGDDRD